MNDLLNERIRRKLDVMPDELGPQNPFENAFRARATLLETETQARAHLKLETARAWRIVNPSVGALPIIPARGRRTSRVKHRIRPWRIN